MEKLIKSDEEWKKVLTSEQFDVLRKKGTEAPSCSPILDSKEEGVYVCVACGNKLFSSEDKFDSGTGWPSFIKPYGEYSVEFIEDGDRTEVLCWKCEGHLGHVFNDGPKPIGKRFCMNGIVLKFIKK